MSRAQVLLMELPLAVEYNRGAPSLVEVLRYLEVGLIACDQYYQIRQTNKRILRSAMRVIQGCESAAGDIGPGPRIWQLRTRLPQCQRKRPRP